MKRLNDKAEVRGAIVRLAAASHPGTLERQDLEDEPAVARADGRTVAGELKRLISRGVITPVKRHPTTGQVLRMQATDPVAEAIRALNGGRA